MNVESAITFLTVWAIFATVWNFYLHVQARRIRKAIRAFIPFVKTIIDFAEAQGSLNENIADLFAEIGERECKTTRKTP